MYQIPPLAYLSILSDLFPLGAGLLLWRRSTSPMRLLTGLLFYGLINTVGLVILALWRGNNIVLLHFYTLISYLLVALIFSYWNIGRFALIIKLSIPLFFIMYAILVIFGYEDLTLPNEYSMSIRGVFIAFISLYTLYTTLRKHPDYPIYQDERFWVATGAFINYSGTVLVYAAIPVYITHALWQIHNTLAILANTLFFMGYLCLRK